MASYNVKIKEDLTARVLEALGHPKTFQGSDWQPATKAEVEEWLKTQLVERVQSYEARKAEEARKKVVKAEEF